MRKKQFSDFSFQIFFGFWVKYLSDFRPKNFKKLSKLPSACPQEQLVALNILKNFESLRIFCRNLRHGSQNSIYVSRVKIAEETVFLFFFRIFWDFDWKFSDSWPKNLKNLWKLTSACPQEQLVAVKFFKKFWTVFDFLQKPLVWFSKFYLRVQSKNCGKK